MGLFLLAQVTVFSEAVHMGYYSQKLFENVGVRLRIYILLLSHTLSLSCSVSLPQARTWCVKWVSSSAWLFHAQAILCTPLSQAEDQAANLCHWLPCWITTRESSLPRCSAHTQTRTPARTIGPIVKLHCLS